MGQHKLYYFEGRNTGVVARNVKEARKLKKRGGDKIVAVRDMTAEEREQGLQGKWIRTRRDGKQPDQSKYGKGRGQGPPRKGANMATRKKTASKKKTVRKKARTPAQRTATRKLVALNRKRVTTARKKTVRRKTSVRRTAKRATNPVPTHYWIKVGSKYYDGEGLTPRRAHKACFTNEAHAKRIARKIANKTGHEVSLQTNRQVKKK